MYYAMFFSVCLCLVSCAVLASRLFRHIQEDERQRAKDRQQTARMFQATVKDQRAVHGGLKALRELVETDQKNREAQEENRLRQEEKFFSGINNIMNYDLGTARKAANRDAED